MADADVIEQEPDAAPMAMTRSAADIVSDVRLIQEVMRAVMKKGTHYDTIPGCGPKPALLKPGAEKIASAFKLAIEPIVTDLSIEGQECRYRVEVRATNWVTGAYVGSGIGECSTAETKYAWRAPVSPGEYAATPDDRRRLKFLKNGKTVEQVRTNPSDLSNTALKMAKKRALVDCVLTVTAASDCFAQDLDELPDEILQGMAGEEDQGRPQMRRPQARQPAATKPQSSSDGRQEVVGKVEEIASTSGENDKGSWTRYGIKVSGAFYGTFSETIAEDARLAQADGAEVVLVWEQKGRHKNVVSLEFRGDGPGPAEGQEEFDL